MRSPKDIKQEIKDCDKAINTIKCKDIETAIERFEYKIIKRTLEWVLNKQ